MRSPFNNFPLQENRIDNGIISCIAIILSIILLVIFLFPHPGIYIPNKSVYCMPRNNIIPKLEYLAVFKSTFREEIPYLLFRVYYICLGYMKGHNISLLLTVTSLHQNVTNISLVNPVLLLA